MTTEIEEISTLKLVLFFYSTLTENYLYAELMSAFWVFVDNVEFFLDERVKVIHIHSAWR